MKNHTISPFFKTHYTSRRHWLCLVCCFLSYALFQVQAQQMKISQGYDVVCPAKFEDMHTRVGIPEESAQAFQKKLQANPTAEFQVTYGPGAEANPEAKAAFQFALDIWANEIVSDVPIRVYADFADLGGGILASAGPTHFIQNFPNAPKSDTNYPAALANSLAGEILDTDQDFDFRVRLGNAFDWYFGTDGNPGPGQYDFITIALHEAGHGLGFLNLAQYFNNGTGTLRGFGVENQVIFSDFIVNGAGERLIDFEDPSIILGDQFVGGDIFVDGEFAVAALDGNLPELYAPRPYRGGSSVSHWDEVVFPAGDPNSLMSPQVGSQESIFDIGNITRGIFKDMGWLLNEEGIGVIRVTPATLSNILFVDETINRTLTINNVISEPVTVTASIVSEDSFISFPNGNELRLEGFSKDSLVVELNASGLEKGVYEETILITPERSEESIQVPVTLTVFDGTEVPEITVNPLSFEETIDRYSVVSKPLTIENTGDLELTYTIEVEADVTDSLQNNFKNNVIATNKAITENTFETRSSHLSVERNSQKWPLYFNNRNRLLATQYATDFESFDLGDLGGQRGWQSNYDDNWVISDENPFEGNLHLRGVSDGLGDTRPGNIVAVSPEFAPGDQAFMVASARINLQGAGTTWEFTVGSFTQGLSVTRLRLNSDRSVDIYINNEEFVPLGIPFPEGYVDVAIEVDSFDATFSVSFNGETVFTGPGAATIIEQVVLLSYMEETGSIIDIDNLEVFDKTENGVYLSVSPKSGTVDRKSSEVVDVKFDARGLIPGEYEGNVTVKSNDTTNAEINIPVSLTVIRPPTIEVDPDSLSVAINVQEDDPLSKTATFTISNTGENTLDFSTSLGIISADPSKPEKTVSSQDQKRLSFETFEDSIFYDTGTNFTRDYIGFNNTDLKTSSAVRFDTDRKFVLSAVRNYYRTETLEKPTVILEIYKGGTTPSEGELLLTQELNNTSSQGDFFLDVLNEEITFLAGESFWVVYNFPTGLSRPQGFDFDAEPRIGEGANLFSGDGGKTWFDGRDAYIYLFRALSTQDNNYLILEPASGTVPPGGSVEVTATFRGDTDLPNGTYFRDIQIVSNDPVTPIASVKTAMSISGQTSDIEISEDYLFFENVFIGDTKKQAVAIENIGLAQIQLSNISIDNPDFTTSVENTTINSNTTFDLVVSFTPSSEGNKNATLTFETDTGDTKTFEIGLYGVGVAPSVAVFDPLKVEETLFAEETKQKTVALKNTGDAPLFYSFPKFAAAKALKNPNDPFDGGTDNVYGYVWIDSDEEGGPVYSFMDISETGVDITSFLDLGGSAFAEISFPFEFYGTTYNEFTIYSTGFIAFEPVQGSIFFNTPLPQQDAVNNIIAPLWQNFNPKAFGAAHYQEMEDRVIVQWTDVTESIFGNPSKSATFQVVLYADGNIDFYYEDIETYDKLDQATVGIENADGSDGIQVAFNEEYLKDKLAIRFIKPERPLTTFITDISSVSGVIAAGGSKDLTVTLDARGLEEGTYFDDLLVSSNSPDKSASTVEFDLTIKSVPQIVSFTLVNADTDQTVRRLFSGDTVNISNFESRGFNIIANRGEVVSRSVVFDFNETDRFALRNPAPYALGERTGRDFDPVEFPLGTNTITATPYTDRNATGGKGTPLSITFEVVDETIMPATEKSGDISSTGTNLDIRLHPNPVRDLTYFSLGKKVISEQVKLSLVNLVGQVIYQPSEIQIDNQGKGQINMAELSAGVYILKVMDLENETNLQLKLVKE